MIREGDDLRKEIRLLRKKFGVPEDSDVRSHKFSSFLNPSLKPNVQLNTVLFLLIMSTFMHSREADQLLVVAYQSFGLIILLVR